MPRNIVPGIDKKTKRFIGVEGKTQKMLDEEKRLGVRFEDDYKKYYEEGDMSQGEFAKRWRTSRTLIFDKYLKRTKGRACWLDRLNIVREYTK